MTTPLSTALDRIPNAIRVRVQRVGAITSTTVQGALAALDAAITTINATLATLTTQIAGKQRSVTASPIVVAGNDQIINFNISSGSPTCALPAAATRSGLPLIFKDAGGHAASHNLTITPNGVETIDGQAQVVISGNFAEITLRPYNDGVNTGWSMR